MFQYASGRRLAHELDVDLELAAWLNQYPNKVVIAPKKWFKTASPETMLFKL
jgi:hypothetical protein